MPETTVLDESAEKAPAETVTEEEVVEETSAYEVMLLQGRVY